MTIRHVLMFVAALAVGAWIGKNHPTMIPFG
jgi:hypothetical protein